jgi:regulator of sigma E protease
MLDPYILLTGLTFLVMMTVLIAAHEYGHYLFARMFGMEVDAFALMLGGVRKTDLASRLEKPLVSGWAVAAVMAALIAGWDLTTRFGKSFPFDPQPVVLALQVGVVLIVPLWIASRLAALYHVSFGNMAKWFVIGWLGWFFVAGAFGVTRSMAITGLIPLLAPVSALGLIFSYYLPVLSRQEEDTYGNGQIKIDGEAVPVQFRPVASKRSKSGTEFSLLLLPLGGFAKIRGMQPREDGSEVNIPGGFFSKASWKRLLVLFAGPLFSILAGVLLLAGNFMISGIETADNRPVLAEVVAGDPAAVAGLKAGDRVVSVAGKPISKFSEMRSAIRDLGGQPVEFVVRRGDKELSITVTPKPPTKPTPVFDSEGQPTSVMRLQATIGARGHSIRKALPFNEAIVQAFKMPVRLLADLVNRAQSPSELKDQVGGIAAVVAATDDAVRTGLETVVFLAAGLSISLGIFNLLPIYPLDGGQMLVAFAEMFRGGRRLSLKVQNAFSTVGFALICMLVLFVLVNDTKKLSGGSGEDGKKPIPKASGTGPRVSEPGTTK